MKKEEFMIHVWGGAWNDGVRPSIEKDLGILPGYHYFDTEVELNEFIFKLQKYEKLGMAYTIKTGFMTRKQTLLYMKLKYDKQIFEVERNFGYEVGKDEVERYMERNFNCDCQYSQLIRNKYGIKTMEWLDCGNEIELVSYEIRLEDPKYLPSVI